MPRIRTIKPTHWNDKELANISLQAHLLWIATWNFSDDKGIFEGDPLLIKSQIFPRRTDIRIEQISLWLDQLVKARFLIPFQFKGEGYYISRTFETHQRIDKPQPSSIPSEFIKNLFQEYSKNDPGMVLPVEESKVKESKVNGKVELPPSGGVEAEASPLDIRDLFKKLVKNKKSICEFIQVHQPDFIEPYVELWNLFAQEKDLSKISKISDTRKKKFKVRIVEKGFDFIEILKKAGQSEFLLTGKWFGFDWIFENESNYLKIIEGNYDKKTTENKADKPDMDLQYLYDTFLEGNLNKKLVKTEHYEFIKEEIPLTEHYLEEAKHIRVKNLIGSNQANDIRLLDDYQQCRNSEIVQKDREVLVRMSKRIAVISYFSLLKMKKVKNIQDGIKKLHTIGA
jgi:hypothetical protein